jgi:starch synthase
MRILLATSELHPYSKTGGLADMVGALAKSLAAAGHQVGVVTPLYRSIWSRHQPRRWNGGWTCRWAPRVQPEIWTLEPQPNLTVYFVHAPGILRPRRDLRGCPGRFGTTASASWLSAKAVVHLARYLPWQPEVVHVHDWQTGLVPLMIRHERSVGGWIARRAPC